jgi:hypothetical protein
VRIARVSRTWPNFLASVEEWGIAGLQDLLPDRHGGGFRVPAKMATGEAGAKPQGEAVAVNLVKTSAELSNDPG